MGKAHRIPWLWIIVAAAGLAVLVGVVLTVVLLTHRQGRLTPNTSTVDFGTVAVATTATQAVTVKNTGPVGTTVSATVSGTHTSNFGVSTAACLGRTLNPNASCVFDVTFKPRGRGSFIASLEITGDHAATKTVALTGTGGGPVATASHVALTHLSTSIWNYTVTITDTGDAPLHVTNATITGTMSIQGNSCLGKAVAPNQQCVITVASTFVSATAPSGSLLVYSDAADNPLKVALAQ